MLTGLPTAKTRVRVRALPYHLCRKGQRFITRGGSEAEILLQFLRRGIISFLWGGVSTSSRGGGAGRQRERIKQGSESVKTHKKSGNLEIPNDAQRQEEEIQKGQVISLVAHHLIFARFLETEF